MSGHVLKIKFTIARRYSTAAKMSSPNVLVYLLRRDLRVSDNPILHSLATQKDHGFTHLLPLYVFSAQQVEVSGFIPEDAKTKSPYPEARSRIANFWRCGPHRAKFLGESVWDLKEGLEKVGSGLCVRVGMVDEVIKSMFDGIGKKNGMKVGAVWMTNEEGTEEHREERLIKQLCKDSDVEFKTWVDEKYLKDDRDLPFTNVQDVPNIFTDYRNKVEPLRNAPRPVLPTPTKDSLPPFPADDIPNQHSPFEIPSTSEALQKALLRPLSKESLVKSPPAYPPGAQSAHPFTGGESHAQEHLEHQIASGRMTTYKSTRNGLLGPEFSTKLSAYLVHGSITARQIHAALLSFEDGTDDGKWNDVPGHGEGENEGTKSVRFELLWRDYMRLCNRKFGLKLFRLSGFRDEDIQRWRSPDNPRDGCSKENVEEMVERLLNGTTGMGFIDASQRELFHTGYTSNRTRQNFASFFAKHLYIDWRIGAEWYECMLVDYDLSSNWGNWQYLAGVGNDPRGEARIFNPVKQAFDYDPEAEYVKTWIPELRDVTDPGEVFQAWTIKDQQKKKDLGLHGLLWVERPLKKIDFVANRGGRPGKGGRGRGGGGSGAGGGRGNYGGRGRGERTMGGGTGQNRSGNYGGGYGGRYGGSSRGHIRGGSGRGRGGGGMENMTARERQEGGITS